MKDYKFTYKQLQLMDINTVVRAKSVNQAERYIKKNRADGMVDFNVHYEEVLKIFDIEFVEVVE